MTSTPLASASPLALESLRGPIAAFVPAGECDEHFKASMLRLGDLLEKLWRDEDDENLESNILATAIYAFEALTASGAAPDELLDLLLDGELLDDETVDTLCTLKTLQRVLSDFRPPSFAAALTRAVLLAVFRLVGLFLLVGDPRGIDLCFDLLDTVEAMADRVSGRA